MIETRITKEYIAFDRNRCVWISYLMHGRDLLLPMKKSGNNLKCNTFGNASLPMRLEFVEENIRAQTINS